MHLSRLFHRSVQMYAQRPALARGGEPAITYAELDRRVRGLAGWFRKELQMQPGDRVAIAMTNCTAYAEAMLAIWHAGLCVVPVNSKLHPAEIGYILEDSGSVVCLSRGAMLQPLQSLADASPGLRLVDVDGADWERACCCSSDDLRAPVLEAGGGVDQDLAWLFYTSGTTGRPKGVMLSHANLVAMALNFHADLLAIDSSDTLIHVAPMSHGSGLYGIPYWLQGGQQLVPASGGFDEAELFELLRRQERSSFFASPTIINRMVQHARREEASLPGLRCIFAGGAPFYIEDIKSAVNCFGPRVAQMYGQGETPMTIAALRAEMLSKAVSEGDDTLLGSVGFPQTTVEVVILDEHGQSVTLGVTGEVTVSSPTVMQGYWLNEAATDATLIKGRLRTGDLGLLDERGLLHLKDRSKDVIISGGTNIYPREVEEVLLLHPAVTEVSVIGIQDLEWGESIAAIVVARAPVEPTELDALCLEHIARFKRPKRYIFVDSLPKNSAGKVLKNELRRAHAS